MFVGGEGLALGPVDVLGTLLHEAAHALAHARGIKDTSRQGRYHNRRYAALAEELGLTVAETGAIGWSATRVPEATLIEYAGVIESLRVALTIQRRAEHALTSVPTGPDQPGDQDPDDDDQGQGGRKGNGNPPPPACATAAGGSGSHRPSSTKARSAAPSAASPSPRRPGHDRRTLSPASTTA
jgi:hypothetical protein